MKANPGSGRIWNLLATYKMVAPEIGGPVWQNISNMPQDRSWQWNVPDWIYQILPQLTYLIL